MAYSIEAKTEISTPELQLKRILRGVRAEADISQEELGIQIGRYFGIPAISQTVVSSWLRDNSPGSIPSCYLGAVSQICSVPPERLMV